MEASNVLLFFLVFFGVPLSIIAFLYWMLGGKFPKMGGSQKELESYKAAYHRIYQAYSKNYDEYNNLVNLLNHKGGKYFLDNAVIGGTQQFTQEELRSLLQLVHPDKHSGKDIAVELTKKINLLRNSLK
jgi:hypothetical protein